MPSQSPDALKHLGSKGPVTGSQRRSQASVGQPGDATVPSSVVQDGRTTSFHPAHHRSATTSLESVSSLLRRLGTPPPDLAADLSARFKRVCEARLKKGEAISSIDLENWSIDSQGDLVYSGQHTASPSPAAPIELLVDEFTRQLALPRPAAARRRAGEFSSRDDVDGMRGFCMPIEDDAISASLSEEDHVRRDLLIEQFTASLTERFGEALMTPPTDLEPKTRSIQPKSIEHHRRFNWNLVLGVATAAAFAAMSWTGYQLNEIRQQRTQRESQLSLTTWDANNSPGNESVIPLARQSNPAGSTDLQTKTKDQPMILELGRKDVAQGDLLQLNPSPASAFAREIPQIPQDLFESLDLGALKSSPVTSPGGDRDADEVRLSKSDLLLEDRVEEFNVFEVEKRRREDSERLEPEKHPTPPLPTEQQSIDPSGEPVLKSPDRDDSDAQQSDPETPQQTRASSIRFIDLTSLGKRGQEILIANAPDTVVRIEFPVEPEIVLASSAADGTTDLRNRENGNVLAQLRKHDRSTFLHWMEETGKDRAANSLIHGRFVTQSGESIYLRPSVEADPYLLSFDPKRSRPSWKLGALLLSEASRLEIDLIVPDDIDLVWQTPFNSARPSSGSATAVLSLADQHNVAIVVLMDVHCSGKLSCHLQYRFQVDGEMADRPLSMQDLLHSRNIHASKQTELERQLAAGRKSLGSASLAGQRHWQNQLVAIEREITINQIKTERLESLGRLADKIQSEVFLDPHLYVHWPAESQPAEPLPAARWYQQQQTIFRMTAPVSSAP